MKVTIDIDCTPQEARTFLGLPNIEPLQDELLAQLQQQLSGYLKSTDPETMLKVWLPEGIKGLGQIQEQFWRQFMSGVPGMSPDKGPPGKPGSDDKKR